MNVKALVTQSCPTLCDPMAMLLCLWNFPGKNTGVGSHSFLQGIFPTQRSNLGLLHCGQILYCLSHQGSPTIFQFKKKKKKTNEPAQYLTNFFILKRYFVLFFS